MAVEQMKQYRIPASITLAQGLLESGAGRSELARKSNNHFGIKCHSDWRGGRVYHDDDLRGECFRKYKNAEQSYEDHAKFLTERPRYASLFKLKVTDYKGWAKGLQRCGYATDRAYANRLIKLIEDYDLYRYDRLQAGKKKNPATIAVAGFFWSCWADLNRRPHPYQGCALPTELQQHKMATRNGLEPSTSSVTG